MQTQLIAFDKGAARVLCRKYREHKHYAEPLDEEIARIYRAIGQGRKVIRAIASIVAAGLHINGEYSGLPKLAIARADAAMADKRRRCAVPFCRRTAPAEGRHTEWICGRHWALTSRAWRRRFFLFRRRGRIDLEGRMWDRLKRQAIERAAGIG